MGKERMKHLKTEFASQIQSGNLDFGCGIKTQKYKFIDITIINGNVCLISHIENFGGSVNTIPQTK